MTIWAKKWVGCCSETGVCTICKSSIERLARNYRETQKRKSGRSRPGMQSYPQRQSDRGARM